MKVKLGVQDAKELSDPTSCLKIGRYATLVDAGLAFSEYYMRPEVAKSGVRSQEIGHISTGIFSSAGSAKALARLLPPDARAEAEEYEKQALSLNKAIREKWLGEKAAPPSEKDLLAIRRRVGGLRTKADRLAKHADYLCTVGTAKPETKAPAAPPKLPPLAGRFIYPRFRSFVK